MVRDQQEDATAQQRRLLRIQWLCYLMISLWTEKSIVDRILVLNSDDSLSNLATATHLYVLTNDVYAAFTMEAETLRDTTKSLDSDLEHVAGDSDLLCRPELSPKWVALLTLEKACVSKISIEDITSSIKKSGGIFKKRLCELGGLDLVFEAAADCYSHMERWLKRSSSSSHESRDSVDLQCLVFLLKCLKIMENATFLSNDNLSNLLEMKRRLDGDRSTALFIQVTISMFLQDKEASSAFLGIRQAFEDHEVIDFKGYWTCGWGDYSSHDMVLQLWD